MLSQIVDSVNKQYPTRSVKFIDPNPLFNGHRFCEKDVTEPDSSRMDTWLFLPGWGDNSLPNTASAQTATKQEMAAVAAGNKTALPDPSICKNALGAKGGNDWYNRMLCEAAVAVSGAGAGASPAGRRPEAVALM